jgi:L-fuconolactonase
MNLLKQDFTPVMLADKFPKHNVDGCVSVQADQSDAETKFLLHQASEFPFIKGIVGWVDLRSADTLALRLNEYDGMTTLKGFRHVVQGEAPGFLRDTKFIEGVRTIGQHGYTYDLLIKPHQFEEALYFVSRLPDIKIVIDHLAKPYIRTGEKTDWELNMAALSSFENVYCKCSGMVTEADWKGWKKEQFYPYLDEILELFGPSRMMYGSDWPVCLLAASYEEQYSILTDYISALSQSEQAQIMGETAIDFYSL